MLCDVDVWDVGFCLNYDDVCCFVMFVVDVIGDHMVESYNFVGMNVSLCLPHLVMEKTLSMSTAFDTLAAVLSMCLLYVSLMLRVKPIISYVCSCILLLIRKLSLA